jgi:hypothetical protein
VGGREGGAGFCTEYSKLQRYVVLKVGERGVE